MLIFLFLVSSRDKARGVQGSPLTPMKTMGTAQLNLHFRSTTKHLLAQICPV